MKKKNNNFGILLYALFIVILIKLIGLCRFQEICIITYMIIYINFYCTESVMSINIHTKTSIKCLSLLRTSDKMQHKPQVFAKTQWRENSRLRTRLLSSFASILAGFLFSLHQANIFFWLFYFKALT